MEKLEELFDETLHGINSKAGVHNQENEERLSKNINEIKNKLMENLYYFKVSNRALGNAEDKFFELEQKLTQMSSTQSTKIVEETTENLKISFAKIEENLEQNDIENEEKQKNVDGQFYRVQGSIEDSKSKSDRTMEIEESVKEVYSDIVKNIGIFDASTMEEIGALLRYSCKRCINDMSEMHEININEITQIVQKEVEGLQQNVKDMMGQENEKDEQKPISNADQFLNPDEYRNPNDLSPIIDVKKQEPKLKSNNLESWDLSLYGTTPEKVNKKISENVNEVNEKSQDSIKSLPDNVIE